MAVVFCVLSMGVLTFAAKHHLMNSMPARITAGTDTPFHFKYIATSSTIYNLDASRCGDVTGSLNAVTDFLVSRDLPLKQKGGPLGPLGNEHIFFHTYNAWIMSHATSMKQPWEILAPAGYMDALDLFKKRFKLSGNLGFCNTSVENIEADNMAVKCHSFADAGLKLKTKTDQHLREQQIPFEHKAAYKKWTVLNLESSGSWSVSRHKSGQDLDSFPNIGIGETIKEFWGVKATGTLRNRVKPISHYVQNAKDAGADPFPICEHGAYQFLKNADSAPSFPKPLITSVVFAKHVLGLMNADSILQSCRFEGLADVHYTKKRKLGQRPSLIVAQISQLEERARDTDRTLHDRAAAGFFLVRAFGRLRFSEAMSIFSMELEIPMDSAHGYLECAARRGKNGTTLEKRTRLLPVVIPTESFTEQGWSEAWLLVCNEAKMEVGQGIPLLPNHAARGGWSKDSSRTLRGLNIFRKGWTYLMAPRTSNLRLRQQTHVKRKKLVKVMTKLQSESLQAPWVELECLTRWSTLDTKPRDACTALQTRVDSSSDVGER